MAAPTTGADYTAYSGDNHDAHTTQVGTLSRSTWLAQASEEPKPKQHTPPSPFNLLLSIMSCLVCPFLGWLAIIFAAQAQIEFRHGHYSEADALCTRSRGTALYCIAIGICLGLGYGILVGAGLNLDWYG